MLEREFEIIVPQSFEFCFERIHALHKRGCLASIFQPIQINTKRYDTDYAEFKMQQWLGRGIGNLTLLGEIESLDEANTKISGIVSLKSWLIFSQIWLIFVFAFIDIVTQSWWFFAGTSIFYFLTWYQLFYFCNRMIKTLEKAVMQ